MLFTRYAAGTDTRNQFTTPPDARLVADMAHAAEITTAGGIVAGTMAVSSGSAATIPVSGSTLVDDDGNWNSTYDCWGPPSDWYTKWDGDTFSTIYVSCEWVVAWPAWAGGNSASLHYVEFRVRNQANPSGAWVLASAGGYSEIIPRDGFGRVFSGTVPGIPMASGQFLEMRVGQSSGTLMNGTITFKFHPRPTSAV